MSTRGRVLTVIVAALGLVGCGQVPTDSEAELEIVGAEAPGASEDGAGNVQATATIDLLPFVCPECVGRARVRNRMLHNECFQSHKRTVPGTSSPNAFRLSKSCSEPKNYEDFSWDNNWIYHLADSTWAANEGGNWVPIWCEDGQGQAYNTYLRPDASAEGGDWYPRHMSHAQQYWVSFRVQGKARSNCRNCPTKYNTKPTDPPAAHLIVMHDLGDHHLGNGEVRRTIRITKLAGVGVGENYWYADGLGWVAFHKSPDNNPMDWSINAANASQRIQWYDFVTTATTTVCQ